MLLKTVLSEIFYRKFFKSLVLIRYFVISSNSLELEEHVKTCEMSHIKPEMSHIKPQIYLFQSNTSIHFSQSKNVQRILQSKTGLKIRVTY